MQDCIINFNHFYVFGKNEDKFTNKCHIDILISKEDTFKPTIFGSDIKKVWLYMHSYIHQNVQSL